MAIDTSKKDLEKIIETALGVGVVDVNPEITTLLQLWRWLPIEKQLIELSRLYGMVMDDMEDKYGKRV